MIKSCFEMLIMLEDKFINTYLGYPFVLFSTITLIFVNPVGLVTTDYLNLVIRDQVRLLAFSHNDHF
jgi:hypothetical protein